jgi:CheY-like chemotaxis protein/signal transduction histidine kinase
MHRWEHDLWKASDVARLLALVESEKHYYQDLCDSLPAGVAVADLELCIISTNRAFRRRFAGKMGEGGGVRLSGLLRGAAFDEALRDVLEGRAMEREAAAEPMDASGGAPVLVTIRRRAPRGLEEEDALLITVSDTPTAGAEDVATSEYLTECPGAAWLLSTDTEEFRMLSPADRRLTADQAHWTTLAQRASVVHTAYRDAYLATYRERIAQAGEAVLEYPVVEASGAVEWRKDYAWKTPSGRVAGLTVDAGQDRAQRLAEAERKQRHAQGRLALRVAHVVNNLLMIVNGYCEELKESLPPGDRRREDCEAILQGGRRLEALAAEMNRLAWPKRYEPEPIETKSWLQELLPRLGQLAQGKTLEAEIPSSPVILRAHREVLEGLLREAVSAVSPHLPEGAPLRLRVLPVQRERTALILWSSGLPAGEPMVARLLEPFSGPKQGADPPLGVAAWTGPWEELGGTVHVDSEPPGTLSLVLTCPAVAAAPHAPAGPGIYLVEDEEGVRALVERVLARAGFRVNSYATAGAAWQALQSTSERPRVIVTDVDLPGQSGLALAREVRRQLAEVRVLIISGASGDALAAEPDLAHGVAFVPKPLSPHQLLEEIRRLLG